MFLLTSRPVSAGLKSKAFPSSHAPNHHTFPIISSFKAASLSCSLLSRYSTLEKCFGLMAMLLNCFWSMELKMTSRERGRMPGSVEVPVTVYVLPSVGNGSVQQLKWCIKCRKLYGVCNCASLIPRLQSGLGTRGLALSLHIVSSLQNT